MARGVDPRVRLTDNPRQCSSPTRDRKISLNPRHRTGSQMKGRHPMPARGDPPLHDSLVNADVIVDHSFRAEPLLNRGTHRATAELSAKLDGRRRLVEVADKE